MSSSPTELFLVMAVWRFSNDFCAAVGPLSNDHQCSARLLICITELSFKIIVPIILMTIRMNWLVFWQPCQHWPFAGTDAKEHFVVWTKCVERWCHWGSFPARWSHWHASSVSHLWALPPLLECDLNVNSWSQQPICHCIMHVKHSLLPKRFLPLVGNAIGTFLYFLYFPGPLLAPPSEFALKKISKWP